MRSLDSWLGLRARWSALDQSGVAIRDMADWILPAVNVGFEERDGRSLNYGQAGTNAVLGQFGRVSLRCHADVWVEMLDPFGVAVQLTIGPHSVGSSFAVLWVRPPGVDYELVPSSAAGAPFPERLLSGARVVFERPGLLVKENEELSMNSTLVNTAFNGAFAVRLA
jgi:hypothetical protein